MRRKFLDNQTVDEKSTRYVTESTDEPAGRHDDLLRAQRVNGPAPTAVASARVKTMAELFAACWCSENEKEVNQLSTIISVYLLVARLCVFVSFFNWFPVILRMKEAVGC